MGTKGIPDSTHKPRMLRSNLDWQERAACLDANPRVFFDPARYHIALAICAKCPVRRPCRESRGPGATGVWGGHVYGQRPGRPGRPTTLEVVE